MKTRIINKSELKNIKDSVLVYGHFSTIHPGHIRYLKYARKKGVNLVVAIIGDLDTEEYRYSQSERASSLALMNIADYIFLLEGKKLSKVVNTLKPKILMFGQEFKNSNEIEIINSIRSIKSLGGRVEFHAGEINYSSSELLSTTEKVLSIKRLNQFRKICKKYGFNLNSFFQNIDEWRSTKLIIIGDTILDQYTICEPLGMSAEAPVLVIKELKSKNFIGGASIVAAHVRSLGAKCELISVLGGDLEANIVKKELKDKDIKDSTIIDSSRPTTFKKRYIVENQKLLRVSRLEDNPFNREIEDCLIKKIELASEDADGIIISDFVYGVLNQRVIDFIYKIVEKNNLMLFADLQCSSQIGNISKYKNSSLLCPNEREARLAMQNKEVSLEKLSRDLIEKTNSEKLIMKLGPEGFIAYDRDENKNLFSQSFPALTANPLDVTGAGDSLLALMAIGLASKQNMFETSAAACCMSSLAVQSMGNIPISSLSLKSYLSEILT